MSNEPKKLNLYQKLIEVRKEVIYIKQANEGYKFKYASAPEIIGAIRSKMDELNLLLVPDMTEAGLINVDSKHYFKATISYTWIDADNPEDRLTTSKTYIEDKMTGCQGCGSLQSYAERYFLYKFFQVATGKDDVEKYYKEHGLEAFIEEDEEPSRPAKTVVKEKSVPAKKAQKELSSPEELQVFCNSITQGANDIGNDPSLKELEHNLFSRSAPFRFLLEYLQIIDKNIPENLSIYLQKTDFVQFLNNYLVFYDKKVKALEENVTK